MTSTPFNLSEIDPCRTVNIVALQRATSLEGAPIDGVRLVLRHHQSGREFALLVYRESDSEQTRVVSDYVIVNEVKGLRVDRNSRGQMYWLKWVYPDGWVTARYMFPDEQDAYQAAMVMGADFSFLLAQLG